MKGTLLAFMIPIGMWFVTGIVAILTSYPFYKAPYVNYFAVNFNRGVTIGCLIIIVVLCSRCLYGFEMRIKETEEN
jgi:hypothetical protein